MQSIVIKIYNSFPIYDHTYFTSHATMIPAHVTTDSCNGSKPVNYQVNADSFILNSIYFIG